MSLERIRFLVQQSTKEIVKETLEKDIQEIRQAFDKAQEEIKRK